MATISMLGQFYHPFSNITSRRVASGNLDLHWGNVVETNFRSRLNLVKFISMSKPFDLLEHVPNDSLFSNALLYFCTMSYVLFCLANVIMCPCNIFFLNLKCIIFTFYLMECMPTRVFLWVYKFVYAVFRSTHIIIVRVS